MSRENVTKIITAGKRVVEIEEIVEKLQFATELFGFINEYGNQINNVGGLCIASFTHEETDNYLTAVELKVKVHPDSKKPQFIISIGYNDNEYLYEDEFVKAIEVFLNSVDEYADFLEKKI